MLNLGGHLWSLLDTNQIFIRTLGFALVSTLYRKFIETEQTPNREKKDNTQLAQLFEEIIWIGEIQQHRKSKV